MRKLTSGNKKAFSVFAIIIICIIAILVWCLIIALKLPKEEYSIEGDNFLYDENYNPIQIEAESKIRKKWNGTYYLKDSITKEEYKLGTQCIAYQVNTKTVNLFGDLYRIYTDGVVSKLSKNNVISKISEDQLYKFGDRKYIVIGNMISNETGTLNTSGYLLILIDKAGNTYLLNNEINLKTIKPITIHTQTFDFDIANEKLIYNEKEIDLKKIIGSTNQYIEPEEKQEDATPSTTIIQNNQQTTTTNQEITSNTTNNQQISTTITVPGSNNNGLEEQEATRSVSLKSITAGSSYLDIKYNVVDPDSKYQLVYALVEGNATSKTIALNKEENQYRITGLNPNQEYKVTIITKQANEDGEIEDVVEDIAQARTTKIESSLKITKMTSTKVYFELKLDKNQSIDYAEIVIYIDGVQKERKIVDISKAITSNGWASNLSLYSGKDIVLKVENAKFENKEINLDIQTKAKNY